MECYYCGRILEDYMVLMDGKKGDEVILEDENGDKFKGLCCDFGVNKGDVVGVCMEDFGYKEVYLVMVKY